MTPAVGGSKIIKSINIWSRIWWQQRTVACNSSTFLRGKRIFSLIGKKKIRLFESLKVAWIERDTISCTHCTANVWHMLVDDMKGSKRESRRNQGNKSRNQEERKSKRKLKQTVAFIIRSVHVYVKDRASFFESNWSFQLLSLVASSAVRLCERSRRLGLAWKVISNSAARCNHFPCTPGDPVKILQLEHVETVRVLLTASVYSHSGLCDRSVQSRSGIREGFALHVARMKFCGFHRKFFVMNRYRSRY